MIFFIKRKCFDDVRGVRGFGLVLLDYSKHPPISLTHLEFSLVMLKESMNPQQIVHRIKVHNARAWQVFMKVVKVALNTCVHLKEICSSYMISSSATKKLNLKAINLEWYIQQSNGMVLPTANEINHYKCKCPPVDSYRIQKQLGYKKGEILHKQIQEKPV